MIGQKEEDSGWSLDVEQSMNLIRNITEGSSRSAVKSVPTMSPRNRTHDSYSNNEQYPTHGNLTTVVEICESGSEPLTPHSSARIRNRQDSPEDDSSVNIDFANTIQNLQAQPISHANLVQSQDGQSGDGEMSSKELLNSMARALIVLLIVTLLIISYFGGSIF